jgi:hypothetical protein
MNEVIKSRELDQIGLAPQNIFLIHTGLQPGAKCTQIVENRFNGFPGERKERPLKRLSTDISHLTPG